MKKAIALFALILLTGCSENHPDSLTCNDYRIMTFYDNGTMPMTDYDWNLRTSAVCVVKEQHIVTNFK